MADIGGRIKGKKILHPKKEKGSGINDPLNRRAIGVSTATSRTDGSKAVTPRLNCRKGYSPERAHSSKDFSGHYFFFFQKK